jgi:alkylation response protein AidB-like acyl-CoA dehydrogenase
MWSVQMPINLFGSDEQKQRYLTPLCAGEIIGAHGMSEPDSGSDAFGLSTTARRDGAEYILNGSKTFVSNAPVADVFIIFAKTDRAKGFLGISAFIVDKTAPGLQVGRNIGKLGLRTSPWSEVIMEDCRVPESQRLGKEGNGAAIFEDSMAWERSFILANYVGGMERQLEACIRYAKGRKQFGRPIGKFQSVANRIVDMKVRLETCRHLLYKVAWMMDNKTPSTMDAAILKLYLSESWIKSCLDATQIHGGYGFTTEYEVERDLRDSIGSTLYSGTSEMQRNLIARHLHL